MESNEKRITTADLNRTLGKKELYSIAFGHVIGAGVFALIGIGIGMTGKSAFIGIILSALFIIVQALPFTLMAGTARFRGGYYSMMSALWGDKFAGFYIIIFFCSNISLAMYAISFAQYLTGVAPNAPVKIVALIVMTVFLITNILGVEGAAKVEIAMDIILAIALTSFIVYGIPKVHYDTFFTEDFLTAGPVGLVTCAVLVTWATAGGIDMVNLSAEAKNPTKDLPQVIMVSTVAIAVFYGLIGVVAAGVLPVEETANQPLDVVAKVIFPKPMFIFFVVGGALLALSTTLNASLAWVTKPLLQACNDGWLPAKLGWVHPKYKTPVVILLLFYAIGLLPILFDFNIGMIADIAVVLSNILFVLICLGAAFMPKKMPELWENSAVKCSKARLNTYAVLGSLSSLIMVIVLLADTDRMQAIGMAAITIAAILFAHFRYKSGKVKPEKSFEEL